MTAFDHVHAIPPRTLAAGVDARPVNGERLTLAVAELEPGAVVDEHSHEHEQLGILLRGSIRFRVADEERELSPGATWCIPSNAPHRAEAGRDGATVIEVFSPPRSEWDTIHAGEPGPGRWP